jgi:2-phospho-L-lactate guanylyltransferase
MRLHAIVPVKALERAKSRLAGTLTPPERRLLVTELFGCVLQTLSRSVVAHSWVVSPDPVVLALAAAHGASPLRDLTSDLNGALEHARSVALAAGAEAILVLPADVPLVTPGDVAAMLAMLVAGADVALARDTAGRGTNALALRAAAELPFSFGEGSAERHLRLAAARGLVARSYNAPTLALDVDDAPALARYRALTTPCRAAG